MLPGLVTPGAAMMKGTRCDSPQSVPLRQRPFLPNGSHDQTKGPRSYCPSVRSRRVRPKFANHRISEADARQVGLDCFLPSFHGLVFEHPTVKSKGADSTRATYTR